MANTRKVLVLNPLTGELQQLQSGDNVFGLVNGDNVRTELTNLNSADSALQTAINTEKTRAETAEGALDGRLDTVEADLATRLSDTTLNARYVNIAGDTMTGPLVLSGAPTVAAHAATKGYVDSIAGGLSWQKPVNGFTVVNNDGVVLRFYAETGERVIGTDNKIYTCVTGATEGSGQTAVWNDGVTPADGYAVFDKTDETGYVYSGSTWVQFTGTGQITAGLGLAKNGNRLDVELSSTGGLKFTPDETSESSVLAVELKAGGALASDADGLYVAPASITNAMLKYNSVTMQAGTGSDVVELGETFAIMGDNATGIRTQITGNILTIDALNASSTQKGVAKFSTGSFIVTDGTVELADVGTAGTYGSSTAIPVITTDAKGRVTAVGTAAINTAASTYNVDTGSLAEGTAVYKTKDGIVMAAKAAAANTVKVVGFVYQSGKIATSGVIGGLSGLTAGDRYFLSAAVAGAITNIAPSADGQFVAPVGVAVSTTELAINLGAPVQL